MTRDDIIRMAQEAGITYQLVVSGWGQHWIDIPVHFERFAALVAAAEREACAYRAGIALLGADRGLSNRVDQAIRARGQE